MKLKLSQSHKGCIPWNKGLSGAQCHTDVTKEKIRNWSKKYWSDPQNHELLSRICVNRFTEHPELLPFHHRTVRTTKPQRLMFDIIKAEVDGIEVVLEFKVRTKRRYCLIDVAIPSAKLGFEYDGKYWHKQPDINRDKVLTDEGWTIAHINEGGLWYIAEPQIHQAVRLLFPGSITSKHERTDT